MPLAVLRLCEKSQIMMPLIPETNCRMSGFRNGEARCNALIAVVVFFSIPSVWSQTSTPGASPDWSGGVLNHGVVIENVDRISEAQQAGLEEGDVVLS